MPTHQLRLNIDLPLLKKQIDDLALAKGNCWPAGGFDEARIEGSIEGVINLLGAIRDQVDPPPVVLCLGCGLITCDCLDQARPFTNWKL